MGWLDYARSIAGSFGREKLRAKLVKSDPTKDYRVTPFFASEIVINELPLFTLYTARLMERSDPVVSFSLNVRNAALMSLEVEVEAKDPRLKAWVEKQWKTLWDHSRSKLVSAKRWGFAASQPKFKEGPDGLLHVSGLKTFAPHDVRALTHGSRTVGFQLRHLKLYHPFACWQTFNAEFNSPYGTGTLRRSYPPWYEKWMDRGAKKLVQLRMIKDAYIGDIFWYPPDQTMTIPTADGPVQLSWRDVFREIAENRLSGGALTLPMLVDNNGNELSKYQPPQALAGASQVFEWEDRLDKQILRGADVPLEVIEAQENGGFSGRSVPLMVLLGVCTQEASDIVSDVDEHVLRPTAWLNFGKEPEYTIKPKSLIETWAASAGGSAMGGGAIGGQAGEKQQPGQQPTQQIPPRPQAVQFDETHHAPPGGVTIHGKRYEGGEFIPSEVVDSLSTKDREKLTTHTIKAGAGEEEDTEIFESSAAREVFFASKPRLRVVMREISDDALLEAFGKLDAINTSVVASGRRRRGNEPPWIGAMKKEIAKRGLNPSDVQFDDSATTDDIATIGASSARSRIRGAASRIQALKKNELTPLTDLAGLIEYELTALHRGISSDLSASMLAGQLTGMADAWTAMPAEAFEPPATLAGAPPIPPEEPPSIAGMFGGDEPPPDVHFPVIEEALEVLSEAPAVARPDFRATAAAVKQGAFAITGDMTDAAVADVRDLLTENLAKGPNRESFIDAVIDRLGEGGPLSEARVENIFRTNVATAISDGMDKSLEQEMVVDAFPYRAYYATTDHRVRKNHLALEKLGLEGTNIYRADDPTWAKFRPPWDFSCRCSWSPVSVEQAARRGVTEAKEWLARAVAMAAEIGGSEYQYFARTAPANPTWVTPPDFQPSPEFSRPL